MTSKSPSEKEVLCGMMICTLLVVFIVTFIKFSLIHRDNQTYKMYHYVGKKLKNVYSYNKLIGEYPSRQQLVGILKTHQLRCIPGMEPTSVVVVDLLSQNEYSWERVFNVQFTCSQTCFRDNLY